MEVRVEGRGLEVHCRRGTSGRFLYDFFVFVFMAWHGMARVCGLGLGSLAGGGVFFLVPEIP